MPMIITDECINCGACAAECPTEAILKPAANYKVNRKKYSPLSMEHFFIVTEFCDECSRINEIKCIVVCPMNAIKKE